MPTSRNSLPQDKDMLPIGWIQVVECRISSSYLAYQAAGTGVACIKHNLRISALAIGKTENRIRASLASLG